MWTPLPQELGKYAIFTSYETEGHSRLLYRSDDRSNFPFAPFGYRVLTNMDFLWFREQKAEHTRFYPENLRRSWKQVKQEETNKTGLACSEKDSTSSSTADCSEH